MTDLLKKIERKHTSIYVSVEIMDELNQAARKLGVTRNILIEAALKEGLPVILEKKKKETRKRGSVK